MHILREFGITVALWVLLQRFLSDRRTGSVRIALGNHSERLLMNLAWDTLSPWLIPFTCPLRIILIASPTQRPPRCVERLKSHHRFDDAVRIVTLT